MEVLIKLFQDGQLPVLAQWLLLVNIIDIATGFIKAIDNKTVSSHVMKHGAFTKVIIWLVIVVSSIVSSYFNTDLTSYVIGYYLVMEIVSIIENASQFINIPDKLKNVLNVNNVETTTEDKTVINEETIEKESNVNTVDSRIFDEIKKMEGSDE